MKSNEYRRDIDGLRALAVISVVCYHISPKVLPGGFFGVDIFFVISGYLISLIIFRELERGEFRFGEFYARRVRRIFPALILVLLTCLIFGFFFLFPGEYYHLSKQSLAAMAFLLNIALIYEAGYFDVASYTKPLLHLWSLSVEEQFYLLWPLMLVLAKHLRLRISFLLAIAAACSFLFAGYLGAKNIDLLYFHPFSRFWELLMGAILGYVQNNSSVSEFKTNRGRTRDLLSIVGIGCVLSAFFLLDGKTRHPGISTLLPILGVMTVVLSGQGAIGNRFLALKPLVWVGLISYPLYLWHWPILSYMHVLAHDEPPAWLLWGGGCLAVVLAWGTYQLLELPIRIRFATLTCANYLVLAMSLLFFAAGAIWISGGWITRANMSQSVEASHQKSRMAEKDNLCLQNFPIDKSPYYCRQTSDKTKLIAVIGDSHAHALYPGIAESAESLGYGALLLANTGCPPLLGTAWGRNEAEKTICAGKIEQILRAIERDERLVAIVFATRGPIYISGMGYGAVESHYNYPPLEMWAEDSIGQFEMNPKQVFKNGFENTINVLLKKRIPVVYMLQVPELGFSAEKCIERPVNFNSKIPQCFIYQESYQKRMRSYRDLVMEASANKTNLDLVDPALQLCDGVRCFGSKEGAILYSDDNHISPAGSKLLSALIFEKLKMPGMSNQ